MTKNNPAKGVCWDLSDLYESPQDPKIKKDFRNALKRAQEFEEKHRGKMNSKDLDAETLLKAVQEQEFIYEIILKPWYLGELLSFGCFNQTNKDFFQEIKRRYAEVESHLLFFDSEWVSVDDNLAESLLTDKKLATYRHFLESKRLTKPYLLSEKEEKILKEKSVTGIQAFRALFLEIVNNIRYKLNLDGHVKELSEKGILNLVKYHPSRRIRRQANRAFAKGLKANANLLTFILNMVAQDKALNDRLRDYPSPLKERNLRNEVEDDSVTNLLRAGKDNHDIVETYYQLKGKILGIKNLKEYDIYVPVFSETEEKITWEDCKKVVLESYARFSPLMAEVAEKFFQDNWIDAELRNGKWQSAGCEGCLPSIHPYISMNFSGKLNDVLTLTHEIGHGIHDYLANCQTLLNVAPPPPDDPPLIVLAEIPSLFGEILTFENLKRNMKDDKARLKLLMERIEGSFATFFRQIAFTRFELMVHEGLRKEGNLSTEKINEFWNKSLQPMFGKAVELTKDYDCCWMYVFHFINVPFYCYAYAFSFVIATALYSLWQKEGKSFVPEYLELLKAGCSMRPVEVLEKLDINLADPNFWQSGVDVLRSWVEEAERLAKSLGLV